MEEILDENLDVSFELENEEDMLEETEVFEEEDLFEEDVLEETEVFEEAETLEEEDSENDFTRGKIPNMLEFMDTNYEKVMGWIKRLAHTSTCRDKFDNLEQNTPYSREDLIQETYFKIYRTFYDNEQRLSTCQNCTHQCSEFVNRTKKTNTGKKIDKKCRPYMYYSYSEADFNNYINRSLKQNIDCKLKKITNSEGRRAIVKLEEPINCKSSDSGALGSLLASDTDAEKRIELANAFLNKDMILKFPLEAPESNRGRRQPAKAENWDNLTVDEMLDASEISLDESLSSLKDAYQVASMDMMEFMPSSQYLKDSCKEVIADYGKYLQEREYDLALDISERNHYQEYEEMIVAYEKLGWVFSEDLKSVVDSRTNKKIDETQVEDILSEVAETGNLEASSDKFLLPVTQNSKTVELLMVEKDLEFVPLPMNYYIRMTVQEFLEMYAESKQKAKEDLDTLREMRIAEMRNTNFVGIYVDFYGKQYTTQETWMPVDCLTKEVITSVFKQLKTYASRIDEMSVYTAPAKKMVLKKAVKVAIPEEERIVIANEMVAKIRGMNNMDIAADTSKEDTAVPNLKYEALHQNCLEKVPTSRTVFVKDQVKVLCTSQETRSLVLV